MLLIPALSFFSLSGTLPCPTKLRSSYSPSSVPSAVLTTPKFCSPICSSRLSIVFSIAAISTSSKSPVANLALNASILSAISPPTRDPSGPAKPTIPPPAICCILGAGISATPVLATLFILASFFALLLASTPITPFNTSPSFFAAMV